MPMPLKGSCRCKAVSFSVDSHTPYPYQLCYCSICRKTAGGGGFAINLMGISASMKVEGRDALGTYHAEIAGDDGRCATSSAERCFCRHCASALWLYDATWPDLVHPFASAIDTELPVPPAKVHLMLRFKPSWVRPDFGPDDAKFQDYPEFSIEDWHRKHKLWID